MTVEKGLLRETKAVHRMIDALVECRVRLQYGQFSCVLTLLFQFYLDDLEDELTTTALRMLVKDLLILFQAGNEGVINVLGTMFASYFLQFLRRIFRTLFRDVAS